MVIRQIIKRFIPAGVLQIYRQYRLHLKKKHTPFLNQPIGDIFSEIYRKNHWQGDASLSGTGSDLEQTRVLRRELAALLAKYQIQSMVDIPCGDFFWMKEVDLGGIAYLGADIVAPLIADNSQRYAAGNISFAVLDLTRDPLPRSDLVFCRDCLVHLAYRDIYAALRQIVAAGGRYLLTTTFPQRLNEDIVTGDWRPLNLEAAPFHFPLPLAVIQEECTENNGRHQDKSLYLWEIAALNPIIEQGARKYR